jgi:hypothetical protein
MLVKKNIVILHPCDKGACAFYRCHAIATLLNTDKGGEVETIVSRAEINDDYILKYTAAVIFFRVQNDEQATMLMHYKRKRGKFGFKIFVDYDDIIFNLKRGEKILPKWNPNYETHDDWHVAEIMHGALKDVDGVTVTTQWLKGCMEQRFGWSHVRILPNAVPRFAFGFHEPRLIGEKLVKPRVLYAGSTCHFSEVEPGDFAGAWIPWMRKAVEEDKIELHLFQMPDFLRDVADKVVLHQQTDAATFPATVAAIGPDFYLAPLADNPFNRAKSNLKLLEASAVGAVLVGSSFFWSPYEEAYPLAKVTPDDTPESLARLFENLCTPTHYNAAQAWQRTMMDEKHYWMDDLRYIARWLRTFFGDTIQSHF